MNSPTIAKKQASAIPFTKLMINLAEKGKLPDALIRYGIRKLCEQRLQEEHAHQPAQQQQRFQAFMDKLKNSPIAIETDAANEQHYEVPTSFYLQALGKNLKYSSCYYPNANSSLDEAEDAMLALYGERARLANGQRILELGCGWGSLTLWMAQQYPQSQITGVSNSSTQREHILARCAELDINNVDIITADINQLELDSNQFDRAISIEMFEHMRNYQQLLNKVSTWLKPDATLFIHVFAHRYLMYPFEVHGDDDWMSEYFFSGGIMPSTDTFLHFQDDFKLSSRWLVDGTHYERTSNHWLDNMDSNKDEVMQLFSDTYGADQAVKWFNRWRIFFMSCAELFGYKNGSEWLVAHYLFNNHKTHN